MTLQLDEVCAIAGKPPREVRALLLEPYALDDLLTLRPDLTREQALSQLGFYRMVRQLMRPQT